MIELAWHERAACRGRDTGEFYVDEREQPEVIASLRHLCQECVVFDKCYDHALTWEQFGYWANTTERQRVVLRRRAGSTRRSLKTARPS